MYKTFFMASKKVCLFIECTIPSALLPIEVRGVLGKQFLQHVAYQALQLFVGGAGDTQQLDERLQQFQQVPLPDVLLHQFEQRDPFPCRGASLFAVP